MTIFDIVKKIVLEKDPKLFPAPESLNLNNWQAIPKPNEVYRAFKDLNNDEFKVVIVGQDPYPIPGIATGIPFGVRETVDIPPSLQTILSELALNYSNDITLGTIPKQQDWYLDKTLQHWLDQGVLLVNASLTCDEYKPESLPCITTPGTHSNYWKKILMDDFFTTLNESYENLIFVFMGKKAQYYNDKIDRSKHIVINTVHPVADHRSGIKMFIGSKVFNSINEELKKLKKQPVKWLVNET